MLGPAASVAPEPSPPIRDVRDVAVIDVGSNSVRLVLYRLEGRAIWTVFNEKVLAGLGRDLSTTGRLSKEGVVQALAALRRFRAVIEGAGVTEVYSAATAAVREAQDGAAFIARIAQEAGFTIDVLSGEAEARASALGVAAGQPNATGVVADLGGSSLELVRLDHGVVGKGVTLPLGPFALGAGAKAEIAPTIRDTIARRMKGVAAFEGPHLHAVGGGWRNLALLHMQMSAYPLNIVHQYELSAGEALDAARLVAHQSPRSLDKIPGLSRKRAETLPYAGLVLEALIERLGVQRITFSAYGLREGLLLQAMPRDVRERDPLIEGCAALGAQEGLVEALGPALHAWLQPAWSMLSPVLGAQRDAVILAAASRLCDMGARLHPDHRADLVFQRVLRAPIAGQTHAERVFLAVALGSRYGGKPESTEARATVSRLLSPERFARAQALGAAMRLGCHLCGRSPALLASSRLTLAAGGLRLGADADRVDLLLGEQTRKRFMALAEALGLRGEIERS